MTGLGVIALTAIVALLPNTLSKAPPAKLIDQVRVLGSGRLLIVFAMTALGYGGTFVAFTFLAPILQDITGFSEGAVSLILVLYGVAIAIGNIAGGKIANRDPVKALVGLFLAQAAVLVLFTFTAPVPALTLVTLAALGFLSFANVPGLQLYVVQLAKQYRPGAVDVASALNIAAFNLGIAVGAWLGGVVVASPLGLGMTPVIGALLVAAALMLTLLSGVLDRRAGAAYQPA